MAALLARATERAAYEVDQDPTDLRPEARRILRAQRDRPRELVLVDNLEGVRRVYASLPATIKVWRRSLGGADSCSGKVQTLPLDDYVKGVLPHEWITSWEPESLKAGAIAIRTYASSWVAQGGKYPCADLCDTTASQVYGDETNPKTNQAVDATRGQVLVKDGQLVFAEYSAENSSPTKFGVDDPPCAGKALFGHGRGMCQWGTQRWALLGKDFAWMALHYYPGATLQGGPAPLPPDAGPAADASRPLGLDGSSVPSHDGGGPTGRTDADVRFAPPEPIRTQPGSTERVLVGACQMSGDVGGGLQGLWLALAGLAVTRAARRRRAR